MERFQDAIDAMNKAIAASPEPQESWMQILMAAYFELDQPGEAAKIAEGLLAKKPDDIKLARNLANIYLQADMNDRAIAVLEGLRAKGTLTDEKDVTQLYQLYHYAEKESEAIATITNGLASGVLKPGLAVYRALAEAHYFSDQIPAAIDAYKQAASFAKDGEISLNTARLLVEEERWADAKTMVQDALQKGVKRPGDAYVILGAVEIGLNNRNAAIAAYKAAAKYPETKTSAESWLKKAGSL
jgi:tetratricopeptide (TPR) repeat protein